MAELWAGIALPMVCGRIVPVEEPDEAAIVAFAGFRTFANLSVGYPSLVVIACNPILEGLSGLSARRGRPSPCLHEHDLLQSLTCADLRQPRVFG